MDNFGTVNPNESRKMPDEENIICWREEALAIIKDVEGHVAHIAISEQLQSDESCIYLNVRTLEGDTYCVSLCNQGFAIKSKHFDTIDEEEPVTEGKTNDTDKENTDEVYYETIYALLNHVSPNYVNSFGADLCAKLQQLKEDLE